MSRGLLSSLVPGHTVKENRDTTVTPGVVSDTVARQMMSLAAGRGVESRSQNHRCKTLCLAESDARNMGVRRGEGTSSMKAILTSQTTRQAMQPAPTKHPRQCSHATNMSCPWSHERLTGVHSPFLSFPLRQELEEALRFGLGTERRSKERALRAIIGSGARALSTVQIP